MKKSMASLPRNRPGKYVLQQRDQTYGYTGKRPVGVVHVEQKADLVKPIFFSDLM